MTHDPPLDLSAVADDDASIEALRSGAGHDPGLGLLRELLLDVERDLSVPARHGSTVVTLASESTDRRLARGGAVVAAVTAGLLTLVGVAAASTLTPPDSPLNGLGQAVRSVAGAVVGAVTPPASPGRSGVVRPVASASPSLATAAGARQSTVAPRASAPGATVSAESRSRAAARQVDRLLDDAAGLIKAGRTPAAVARLDLAERTLTQVLPADRADLPQRLAGLRAQATASPTAKQTRPPKPAEAGTEAPPKKRTEPRGSSRTARPKSDGPQGTSSLGQSSSDASMKPRA